MFSISIGLASNCMENLQDLLNKSVPSGFYADIVMCEEANTCLGRLGIFCDPSRILPEVSFMSNNSTLIPWVQSKPPAKRRLPIASNSKSKTVKAPVNSQQIPVESLIMNKANPESLLNISQDLATGEKTYRCSFCDYISNRKDSARRHIELKHLPSKSVFKCQLCVYTANLKHNLKTRVKAHSLPEQAAKAMLDCFSFHFDF